ncbi:signal peptidase I [candidate division WWE3 bacterium CG10_big_fil_rev_8_21_14_0_10_32_10]|uniref:Signal peptidase I n=1 Tax=candidate division WWE3 bacterium CG10_big_fil_rev_8_21_14_0_10_32_10 TaxID=1975090 RepID=A0A2H0RA76_UNCKA|nr:MAG: signal peptidase I [candidate division WWE3 bacterium CG10_big_fil_rev_8_21_14_0_10_32_10]
MTFYKLVGLHNQLIKGLIFIDLKKNGLFLIDNIMKILKKIFSLLYWLVIVFLVFLSLSLFLSKFDTLNYRIFSVTSGSMKPSIKAGSLVVVVPKSNYSVKDVITFYQDKDLKKTITHRIIEKSEDKDNNLVSYKTKGDANEDKDIKSVSDSVVIGKVLFSLPYLGYPIEFSKTQMGFVLLVVIPATIIIYSELNNIKSELFKNKKTKGE